MAAAAASSVTHNNGLGEEPSLEDDDRGDKEGRFGRRAREADRKRKDVMQHTKDKIFLSTSSLS